MEPPVPPVVRRYAEAFVRHDLAGCAATFAPEARYHYPGSAHPARREELPDLFEPLWTGFPDARWETLALTPVTDRLTAWLWALHGTQSGPLYGRAATGRRVVWPGAEFIESAADRIVRVDAYFDLRALLEPGR